MPVTRRIDKKILSDVFFGMNVDGYEQISVGDFMMENGMATMQFVFRDTNTDQYFRCFVSKLSSNYGSDPWYQFSETCVEVEPKFVTIRSWVPKG